MQQKKNTQNQLGKTEYLETKVPQTIQGILCMMVIAFGVHLGSIPAFYFIIKYCILEQNIWCTLFAIALYYYQIKFAKKQPWFLKTGILRKCRHYFKEWSVTIEEPIADEKALIVTHPHGVISWGLSFNAGRDDAFKNDIVLASRVILALPLSGLILKWFGVTGVNQHSLVENMKQKKNIAFLPGGFEEATLTSNKENRAFIKKRKGFVKYALQYGYTLYPTYLFGENQTYYILEAMTKLRLLLNKYKLPALIFFGQFLVLPFRNVGIHSVVGKGIKLPQISNPTKEDVDKYHKIYIEELENVYNRYTEKFNGGPLKIY